MRSGSVIQLLPVLLPLLPAASLMILVQVYTAASGRAAASGESACIELCQTRVVHVCRPMFLIPVAHRRTRAGPVLSLPHPLSCAFEESPAEATQ